MNAWDANDITREYLDSLLIEMRHLDGTLPSTKMTLYGQTFDTPIMVAAFSHLNNTRENGMVEIARGAKASGAVNWAGMGSEEGLEAILATGEPTIKIVKPYANNDDIFKKLAHAERAGALAVGMDIDHSFGHDGGYDNVMGFQMKAKSTAEIRAFTASTKLPFIVKGVLSVSDAEKCRDAGVSGIVVSHHHGMIPYAVPPLMVLPDIVKAVGDSMDIFVDCGIASGSDAFKALALGATAVCVGRAMLPALRESGAEGAADYLKKATAELAAIMAHTACPDIRHIDPALIRHK